MEEQAPTTFCDFFSDFKMTLKFLLSCCCFFTVAFAAITCDSNSDCVWSCYNKACVSPVGIDVCIVTSNLRYRTKPDLSATVSGTWSLNAKTKIIDGPVSADGYFWYQFSKGWSAFRTTSGTDRYYKACDGTPAYKPPTAKPTTKAPPTAAPTAAPTKPGLYVFICYLKKREDFCFVLFLREKKKAKNNLKCNLTQEKQRNLQLRHHRQQYHQLQQQNRRPQRASQQKLLEHSARECNAMLAATTVAPQKAPLQQLQKKNKTRFSLYVTSVKYSVFKIRSLGWN